MTPEQIRSEILADEQLRAWIEQGNDQAVANALSPLADPVSTGELFTERAVFAAVGPIMGESIFSKLESFASTGNSGSSIIKRGLAWLHPSNGGLDFQNADVKQMLTGLHVAGILSADELAALTQLGLQAGEVTVQQVGEAVLPWRPDGKIQPIPEV